MERLPFTAAGRRPLVRFRSPLKFTGRLVIVQSPLACRDGFIQARRLRLPTSGSFRNWPTLGHVVGGVAANCHGSIRVAFAASSSESPARRLTSRLRRPTFNRRAGPSPSGLMDSRRDGCGSIRQGTASRGPSSQPTDLEPAERERHPFDRQGRCDPNDPADASPWKTADRPPLRWHPSSRHAGLTTPHASYGSRSTRRRHGTSRPKRRGNDS
jgi:hypothetical protein